MGQATSKEEELFVRGEFAEVIAATQSRPAFTVSPGAATKALTLSAVEWEALCALCEDGDKPNVLRTVAAKLERVTESSCRILVAPTSDSASFQVDEVGSYCPLMCCFVQLILMDAGIVVRATAESQWRLLLKLLVEGNSGDDDADASRAVAATSPQLRSRWAVMHGDLVKAFVTAVDAPFAEAEDVGKAARRALSALNVHLKSTSPVLKLIFQYTAASVSTAAANEFAARGNSQGAQSWLITAIDHVQQGAKCVLPQVQVRFLEAAFPRLTDTVLDMELHVVAKEVASERLTAALSRDGSTPVGTSNELTWQTIRDRFVGQAHCIDYLESHFKARSRKLTASCKPSVFVFFGPSGHGKTELAKLIAGVEHGRRVAELGAGNPDETGHLVTLHMTSYCTRDSVYSLVDPPAAHVGEGILISALRKVPDAVVILDEFEKSSADAVQHVWLSAFPRHGKLHSLKDATRSVSTEEATFVLTCNIAESEIANARAKYLQASTKDREVMRQRWSELCEAELVKKFGQPFVSRVDAMLPFVPYDDAETREFVLLQLNSKKREQQRHGRDVLWTESFLASVTEQCTAKGFHAPKAEQIMQPHLIRLYDHAVAATRASERFVLLHTVPCLRGEPVDTSFVGASELIELGLPGATAVCRAIQGPEGAKDAAVIQKGAAAVAVSQAVDIAAQHSSKSQVSTPRQKSMEKNRGATSSPLRAATDATAAPPHSHQLELQLETVTEREKALEIELSLEREKVVQLQKEVETLKQTVLQLQTALGLALAVIVSMLLFMSLFVSLSTLISWVAISVAALQYFVGNAAFILSVACRGLLSVLGPARSAALGVVLFGWLLYHADPHMRAECPKCPASSLG